MTVILPQATDTTASKSHSKLHRVFAVDSSATDELVVANSNNSVTISGDLFVNNVYANTSSIVVPTANNNLTGFNTFTNPVTIPNANTSNQAIAYGQVATSNASAVKTALNAAGSAPIYACRAWCLFKGNGTVSVYGSGNVTSISDYGVGDWGVNLTTALDDTNAAVNVTCDYSYIGTGLVGTTSVIWCYAKNGSTAVDATKVSVSVFR